MGRITVLPETTLNPISLIGARAGVCWGGDITDAEKNYKRGLDCIESGHGRTLEYVNVELVLEGYSARVIREWYTHLGGSPTRLQASTRYILQETQKQKRFTKRLCGLLQTKRLDSKHLVFQEKMRLCFSLSVWKQEWLIREI